jgi:hypothetical protein
MITQEEVLIGISNSINKRKTGEYIQNSKCGICDRKLVYGKDYVWCEVSGENCLAYTESSYNGKIFLNCHRCHKALIFTDKIRYWIMKFLMRL